MKAVIGVKNDPGKTEYLCAHVWYHFHFIESMFGSSIILFGYKLILDIKIRI